VTRRLLLPAAALLGAASLGAQPAERGRAVGVAPTIETWRFSEGLYQFDGSDSVRVKSVAQLSVPWSASVAVGGWTVDADGAYAAGTVTLAGVDPRVRASRYTLNGPTDTRVRVVGPLVRDRVLLTLGATAPTGRTTLDLEQLAAVRVLAAPALALATPAVGNGAGATAGLILAQQAAGWALALGGTYEVRGSYSPITAIVSGTDAPDYRPGNTVHLSLAADRLVGASGMTISLATDLYGGDVLTLRAPDEPPSEVSVQLGPTVSLDWQLRLASPVARELTLYASDHYRARFKRAGATVAGSDGHQVEAGMRSVLPLSAGAGLVVHADARYHTGLRVDNTLATAAVWSTGATLGVRLGSHARGYTVTPFVRGRYGVFGSDDRAAGGGFAAGGLTLGWWF
jgi:hypothetical protein